MSREPAVIIGIIAACLWAVVQTLSGQGVIGADVAATIGLAIDPAQGGWLIPLVVGIVTRFFVYAPATFAAKP